MAGKTSIEWTDESWNPTRGCAIVSKGCARCYAMRQGHRHNYEARTTKAGKRVGAGAYYELTKLTKGGPVWTGKVTLHPELLDWPLRLREPSRIFVNSMSDLFYGTEEDRRQCEKNGVPFQPIPFQFIADVFAVMACTTRHKYQVLTKRPERMLEWLKWLEPDSLDAYLPAGVPRGLPQQIDPLKVWPGWTPLRPTHGGYDNCGPIWPLENVWLGVSVEDQRTADERIPLLLQTPAAVRWISAEPLLAPVNLEGHLAVRRWRADGRWYASEEGTDGGVPTRLHWVVAGGESGPGARPMHPDWARTLRDHCATAGVAFFFKQWGAHLPGEMQKGDVSVAWQDGRREYWGDHADIKYSESWLSNDAGRLVIGYRVGKKKAGRHLDGRTHDEYPA